MIIRLKNLFTDSASRKSETRWEPIFSFIKYSTGISQIIISP